MKQTAIKAAKLAGKVIMDNYSNIGNISVKENKRSLLTKTDLEAEKTIISTINKKFPSHNIISEEAGIKNKNSEYTWIIDPIDGTTNFIQKIPNFCISIAAAKNKKIILGVVYNPLTKELFAAEKNKGAFLNNKKIKVSDKSKISEAIFGFSLPSSAKHAAKSLHQTARLYSFVRGIRNTGSAAINLCNVACGRYDVYHPLSINSWDVAAGYLIVKEAGGKVTDLKGKEWDLDKGHLLATNKKLHNKFLKLLNKK